MRGLLIKDFKLMKGQKNFFIITLVAGVGMAAFMDDASFVIGYMTFLGAMFTLSSISYDEFDNGNTDSFIIYNNMCIIDFYFVNLIEESFTLSIYTPFGRVAMLTGEPFHLSKDITMRPAASHTIAFVSPLSPFTPIHSPLQ